jgi:subtilisin-like proprotein convertase family protein
MKKKFLYVFVLGLIYCNLQSQTDKVWNKYKGSTPIASKSIDRSNFPKDYDLYQLDFNSMKQILITAPNRFSNSTGVIVTMPNRKGKLERFQVYESSNFTPELQLVHPDIRAYIGIGLDDKLAQLRLSISPQGIQTMVFRTDARNEFMEPYSADGSVYAIYNSSLNKEETSFVCSTIEASGVNKNAINQNQLQRSNTGQMKVVRLALSCTGEYTSSFGGAAGAFAQMNATMTRVNGVFEKDLAIHMNMVDNTAIIFTDAANDPYATATSTTSPPASWNSELQATLTSLIGEANYDIGHLFGASGGGGNAGCIGCVCVDGQKGSGITSPGSGLAMGDNFDIDYVVHEMGHQFGGNHTFSFSAENNDVNVEPGSGSTIMAYAGITGATDVQAHSDAIFAYRSILQIQTYLSGSTVTCPITTTMSNHTPTANAGSDWTIPVGTPFVLTGSGADIDNDALTYIWEENDDATSVGAAASYPSPTKINGPNFRTYNVTNTPVRYFPALSSIISNTSVWEKLSTVARVLNFTLTARDNVINGGQTSTDEMVVNVNPAVGPFDVTSQVTDGISWNQGTTQTVSWSVNNTNTLTGASNVDIFLSTDGGLTFPTVLATNTPNDGSENITVPNVAAPFCRLMVKPTGNIFFDINSKTFAIGYTVTTTTNCRPYTKTFATPAVPSATGYSGYAVVVPDSFVISDFNVSVDIDAVRTKDVSLGLALPGGTTINSTLFQGGNCANSSANLKATFDDAGVAFNCGATSTNQSYIPVGALNTYNGMNALGTWNFAVKRANASRNVSINSVTFTFCETVTTTVLNVENFDLAEFKVYPNPNKGNFTVQFNSSSSNEIAISVHDMRGRTILNNKYSNTGLFSQNVQLDQVEAGIYLVTVQDGDKKVVKRIIIE